MTTHSKRVKEMFLGLSFATLVAVGVPMPAQAAMVGSEQLLQAEQHALQVTEVQQWLVRDDVRSKLEALGVDQQLAAERVAALTDQELQQMLSGIDTQPAGADVIGVIGVVFLVLLILELVGVTDIFKAI
jgi:hypothetical protein